MANENTLDNLDTAVQETVTALKAGDYVTAKKRLAEATIFWAFLPSNVSTSSRAVSYKSAIDAAKKAIEDHELAAVGGQTRIVPISFGRPC